MSAAHEHGHPTLLSLQFITQQQTKDIRWLITFNTGDFYTIIVIADFTYYQVTHIRTIILNPNVLDCICFNYAVVTYFK